VLVGRDRLIRPQTWWRRRSSATEPALPASAKEGAS